MTLPPVDSKKSRLQSRRVWAGAVVIMLAVGISYWLAFHDDSPVTSHKGSPKIENKASFGNSSELSGSDAGHAGTDSHAKTDGHRPTLPFRTEPEESSALKMALVTGEEKVEARVRTIQGMRGTPFSEAEREAALVFLAGTELPEGMSRGSVDWLSDELLTALRLQEPPWDGLPKALAEVAFQPETNPVVRDYIMQHLGHLWEQYGAREEIEKALWKAVGTSDETTPGSALIALSRGYTRDQREKDLVELWQKAFELARNPEAPLALRVTALSIAGASGSGEVKTLADALAKNPATPVILKKVAERIGLQ